MGFHACNWLHSGVHAKIKHLIIRVRKSLILTKNKSFENSFTLFLPLFC